VKILGPAVLEEALGMCSLRQMDYDFKDGNPVNDLL
jgi:hypothetical protein